MAAFFLLPAFCLAQVRQEWVERYNREGEFAPDKARAMTITAQGKVCVTGSNTRGGNSMDYTTNQYAENGEREWKKTYNGPIDGNDEATAITSDKEGNIYITGNSPGNLSGDDIVTIKYDKNGNTKWTRRYNGPGNWLDEAASIAVDAEGNVYVTGESVGDGTGSDFVTIRYNASGSQQWVARYNSAGPDYAYDGAVALALDASGNIYVTGWTAWNGEGPKEFEMTTIKYNPAGVQQWVAVYGSYPYNRPTNLEVDSDGNPYITGMTGFDDDDENFTTIKYNTNGIQQWVATYQTSASNYNYRVNALALDLHGNVFIAGTVDGTFTTIKYNNSGVQDWVRLFNSGSNGSANDLAVDQSGDVHVTGFTTGTTTGHDYVTIKYSRHGGEIWAKTFNDDGNGTDDAVAVSHDQKGNVYVTGTSQDDEASTDYATIKYDSRGEQLWVKKQNGFTDGDDIANDLALDPSGNVLVSGWSDGDGTGYDFMTVKYDASGEKKWTKKYDGPGHGNDQIVANATDAEGNVFVTGTSVGTGTGADMATIKYDRDGNTKWTRRYNGPGNGFEQANAIAVDASGNVYVTGQSAGSGTGPDFVTIKYDKDGNVLWTVRYNGPGNGSDETGAVALDAAGNVYVTGTSWGMGTHYDYATIKYNPNGVQQWVSRYNGPAGNDFDIAYTLALDAAGNVFVTGMSSGPGFDYATVKYNNDGAEQWVQRYDGPGHAWDQALCMVTDHSGNVYVSGGSVGGYTDFDFATIKYSSLGEQLWVARYNGPVNGPEWGQALALDQSGFIYVTGYSRAIGNLTDYATVKYNPDGVQEWEARYNGPGNNNDQAKAIAIDASNNVYVTGFSMGTETGNDFATIRYSQLSASVTRRAPAMVKDEARADLRISHYPNPVSSTARIDYELPYDGLVSIRLYDLLGREVAVITNTTATAGIHSTSFNVTTLKKGVYYYRLTLQTENKTWVKTNKITIIK